MPTLEIRSPDAGTKTVEVTGPLVIGRDAGCDVQVTERKASRKHLKIARAEDGAWVAEDLDSSNGTFLGELRVLRHRLLDGQVLRVGDTHFAWKEAAPAVSASPLVGGRLALRRVDAGAASTPASAPAQIP